MNNVSRSSGKEKLKGKFVNYVKEGEIVSTRVHDVLGQTLVVYYKGSLDLVTVSEVTVLY